jgi:hypothetical protein
MKYVKAFKNFSINENMDVNIIEEIDNWIEANTDYISASSLEDKLRELTGNDTIEVQETTEKNPGEYGENWNDTLLVAKMNGKDLMKVYLNSDYMYNFGKNSIKFKGQRFFFDETILN